METQGSGAGGCGINKATFCKIKVLEAKTSNKRVVIQLSLLKKRNKTTQNTEQPKHLTDLLTTDIKESILEKIHCRRHLVLQGNLIKLLLADQHSVSGGIAVLTGTQTV